MDFSFLPNSLVNDIENPSDYASPYSFLSFIQYEPNQSFEIDRNFKNYQKYLFLWTSKKNVKKSEEALIVRDAYINLLREITLNFTTEEEKRFILNADFEDDSDLDIIIPFFIQKLKQISFYYKSKRKDVKSGILRFNLKGSNVGIETVIKKIILDYINENVNKTTNNNLSSFLYNFDVDIEELYSKSDFFYDKPEDTTYTHTTDLDKNLYLNFKQSIVEAISAYPLYLNSSSESYLNTFTVNYFLSGNEYELLKLRDFKNYYNNGNIEDLKLNLLKSLYPKFIGTDFYYISTNSNNQAISGVLFESEKNNNQFLNKHYATKIFNQPLDQLYSLYELGGFFIPDNQGLLRFDTPVKKYKIDNSKIQPNKVYVFPNPDEIGNTIYTSEIENFDSPLVYTTNVDWNRTKISNGFRFNDVISNNYNKLFYGYQSKQQNVKISTEGIAKVTDNITFWGGEKDQIWEGSFDVDLYPIDKDTNDLLLDEGVVVDWYIDEFSNEFGLYKKLNSETKFISGNINDGGVIDGSSTSFIQKNVETCSIYEKKNLRNGKVFVRNNFYKTVSNFSDAFAKILFKYPNEVVEEIKNKVLKLFIINDIFVIETENYVVSDSYRYDIENNEFQNSSTKPFYTKKIGFNKFLDTFINPWYDEKNKKIFLIFLKTLENSLSASNYKYISPEIYASDINFLNYSKIYPLNKTLTNIYSLSSPYGDVPEINLVEYSGGSFRKNSFLNEYNFTYFSKNLNSLPFIINEKLYYKPEDNTFVSEGPLLLKPFYYFLDNNYANPSITYYVRAISNKSGYIGVRDVDSLNIVETLPESTNYAFATNVETLQINEIGKYVVHFDWESSQDVNIFIGDQVLNIKDVEQNLIVSWKSNNNSNAIFFDDPINSEEGTFYYYLTAHNEPIKVCSFVAKNIQIDVTFTRPTYPYDEVVFIETTTTNGESFSGFFVDEFVETYKKLKIEKVGSGVGDVLTDPPCILCGPVCEYLYPIDSTITLVASAGRNSRFLGWLGDTECYGTNNDCVLYLNDNKTLVANFELLPQVNLNVDTTIGSAITFDGQLNCIGKCTTNYFLGTYVTLSASPPPNGFLFNRFDGIPCYSGDRVCTFIMWDDVDVKLLYREILYYDLTLSIESQEFENDAIIINTEAGEFEILQFPTTNSILANREANGLIEWYHSGTQSSGVFNSTTNTETKSLSETTFVSLTAKPTTEFYQFNKWIGGPCNNSTNSQCSFTMNDNQNIVAYFNYIGYTVSVTYSAGGGTGRVYSVPAGLDCEPFNPLSLNVCEYDFLSGKSVTIVAENNFSGSTFLALCADDPNIKGVANINTLTFTITGNVSLTAVYLPFGSFEFWFYKSGPNTIIFNSTPEPNGFSENSTMYLDTTKRVVSGIYIEYTPIDIVPLDSVPTSTILYYQANVPLDYVYVAGSGIILGAESLDISSGNNTGLIQLNQSLIIENGNLGAPYAHSNLYRSSSGLTISYGEYQDFVITQNTHLSAFLDYKSPFKI